MRDDKEWLLDILEAIENIDSEAAKGKEAFQQDKMIQVWILHHIQIIGEAANRLSEPLRSVNPDIPWADVVAMRNVLVHHYFGIDLDEIWDTVQGDLPFLKTRVLRMVDE